MEIHPVSFREAVAQTDKQVRHLLLGNGFSIAARPSFHYRRLYDVAVDLDPGLGRLFEPQDEHNFEAALLRLSQQMQSCEDEHRLAALQSRFGFVQEGLVRAITEVHPASSFSLRSEEYQAASDFLGRFIGKRRGSFRGKAFTTNYDLLLYWTVVRQKRDLKTEDGFLYDEWRPTRMWSAQVFFLHGGLHLYESNRGIERIQYNERRLVQQIRDRLETDRFPLFVSEATSADKALRIGASDYLKSAWKRFEGACGQADGALFTFGHSLSDQDAHIVDAIGRGQIRSIYLGVYGGLDAQADDWVSCLTERWNEQRVRSSAPPIREVWVFDSSEAAPWKAKTDSVLAQEADLPNVR